MSGNKATSWKTTSQEKRTQKVQLWKLTKFTPDNHTPDNHTKAEMLAEVNEVYHRYGRYPTQHGYWTPGPRPQGFRAPFSGGRGGQRPFNPRHHTQRQAYMFKGTKPHTSINYTPGNFNMGAPFLTHHQVSYGYQ